MSSCLNGQSINLFLVLLCKKCGGCAIIFDFTVPRRIISDTFLRHIKARQVAMYYNNLRTLAGNLPLLRVSVIPKIAQ